MRLFAAGSNAKGQLATGDHEDAHSFRLCKFLVAGKEVVDIPGNIIVKVVAGANHSIALLENPASLQRSLWGAGDGSNGQLGPRFRHSSEPYNVYHPLDVPLPNGKCSIRDVCAAWETSFIRVRDGIIQSDYILSFGSNDHGMLGLSSGVDPLDVNTVDFSSTGYEGTEVALFITGARTAYAVMKDPHIAQTRRVLVGWGASRHNQMTVTSGGPNTTQIKHPMSTTIPQEIQLPQDSEIESIATGFQHALILTTSGRLLGLGSNNKGQLSVSTSVIPEVGNPSSIGATWNSSFILDESRRNFFACGSNNHGQLGGVLDPRSLAAVSLPDGFMVDSWVCGSEHVLVLAGSVCIHL